MPNKKPKTKTGRNDPCPCGSGLKYKKCCLHKHRNAKHEKSIQMPVATKKITSLRPITPVDMRKFKVVNELLKNKQ